MEAIFLARRALFNIPRVGFTQTARKVTGAYFSTAFERAEGSNAVAESRESENSTFPVREGLMEARKRELNSPDEKPAGNVSGYAADTAKDGVGKATEMAENVGETAKGTLDGAWKAGRETVQGIREAVSDDQIEEDPAVGEIEDVDQPIDTQEYRGIEELKGKTGGFMRADQV